MNKLKINNLVKAYSDRRVVDNINIEIGRGEIVGLLGPNGAGKTTSFYMIVGLIKPDEGTILFDEKNITGMPMYRRAREGIGYLCQEDSIFRKLTVEENIMAVLETLNISAYERRRRLDKLLNELSIASLAKNKAYTLSGGERRRLEITRALVTEPSFLLLDEPFSGIDPIAVFEAQQIIQGLRDGGLGILLTDHSVRETLAITDRSYIMYEGKILISGTSKDLISNPKARQIYLGEQFTM
ncbi:MAG: LPS export ABC transporter ATP-binding protein [Candidatus Orphnella occulta]|nr:LPS export ABC transporter ATP-binding protein [Candidatus Orphnella occulta]MDP8297577.1 LPS export ABC transporter ATP-binding protein [Candidatus Orphnella occulta]